MAGTTTATKPKPRLNVIDDLLNLNEEHAPQPAAVPQAAPPLNPEADTYYTEMLFSEMQDFPSHPFRLYEGERKQDMVDSIRAKGILQPIILRLLDDGSFQILAGHNRKYCGLDAGLTKSPVIVKRNLTDEEAWIYVIETNILQRSFADMLPSEKAAVLAMQHSKLFSPGKRNDIIAEIKRLENPDDSRENSTSSQNATRLTSSQKVGLEYGLGKDTVVRWVRINKLIQPLKNKMDMDEILFTPASEIAFLSEAEQIELNRCLDLNKFSIDTKNAPILHAYHDKGKLDAENIYLILNGEIGKSPPKKRNPTVKIKRATYNKYFSPNQTATEISQIVEQALEQFFQNRNREQETPQENYPGGDDADHDGEWDGDIAI